MKLRKKCYKYMLHTVLGEYLSKLGLDSLGLQLTNGETGLWDFPP